MRPADQDLTLAPGQLVTCVVQDARSGDVLMVAWADQEALDATRETGLAHFHSRSRNRLWKKGETSGNTMAVESIAPDCDGDALLVRVHPAGPACHTGEQTCFGPRRFDPRPAVLAEAGSPQLVAEVADLWFHSMLLLARDGIDPLAPLDVLRQRRG